MQITVDTILSVSLTAAFTLWAGVVFWLGRGLREDIRDANHTMQSIRKDLQGESEKLNQYIVQTETRLAVLEDRVDNHG